MKRISRTIQAEVLQWEEITPLEKKLIKAAIKARENAQAPYSNFYVGAAILGSGNKIFAGCNVERASYTQTTHAEQNAIDNMVVQQGSVKIKMLAVVAAHRDFHFKTPPTVTVGKIDNIDKVGSPCGQCLQIVWENCHNDPHIPIIELFSTGQITRTTIGDAFPMKFGPADLGIVYK